MGSHSLKFWWTGSCCNWLYSSVIWLSSLFLGRGTMTLVVHWLGGVRLLYTVALDYATIASPPFWSATAVIALSSPAALLDFIWRIAIRVSSRFGGLIWIGKSWAAGGGSSDGVWPLLSLSKELKYSFQSASRSLSLVGGVSSLLLTLTLVFLSLPESLWSTYQKLV